MLLSFLRRLLGVKCTTSNVITYGEFGQIPISRTCDIVLLKYANKIYNMPDSSIVKRIFNELQQMECTGFTTWLGKVHSIANSYNLDITSSDAFSFDAICKNSVYGTFINDWTDQQNDIDKSPKLRLYAQVTNHFGIRPYLIHVKDRRYRNAISKIRSCSSHILRIEKGRYTRPITPVEHRLCETCCVIEDEIHFIIHCSTNPSERVSLYSVLNEYEPHFKNLSGIDKFYFLMRNEDPKILKWFGIFLYNSFIKRNDILLKK